MLSQRQAKVLAATANELLQRSQAEIKQVAGSGWGIEIRPRTGAILYSTMDEALYAIRDLVLKEKDTPKRPS